MRHLTKICLLAALLWGSAALAQPVALKGTLAEPGDVEIVSNGNHQFVKFGTNFAVESQAECEVRHLDGQTGQSTIIGQLVSKRGYQVYQVPEGLVIDSADRIVVYSPLIGDELATVELQER